MKKIFVILGLICTTGFACAQEIASVDTLNVTQQAEVQRQLDKQTFDKKYFNNQEKFNPNFEKKKEYIKFDKSVTDKKFKDGQPQKFDKCGKHNCLKRNCHKHHKYHKYNKEQTK